MVSNGIYHHYANDKIIPQFSETFFRSAVSQMSLEKLPMTGYTTTEELCNDICPVMFNPEILPKRVNKADGVDVVKTSACNYYEGVSQQEAEDFYNKMKAAAGDNSPSWGLNTKLIKGDNGLEECIWSETTMYGEAIRHIIYWLDKAKQVAENSQQKHVLDLLIAYYRSGNLHLFDEYSIEWLKEQEGTIDFINGFIEVYGDPLGFKHRGKVLWSIKTRKQHAELVLSVTMHNGLKTIRLLINDLKKAEVRGVTAKCCLRCYAWRRRISFYSHWHKTCLMPTGLGRNMGRKSVTISNITDAYNKAAKGNGFKEEFVIDEDTREMISRYGDICDNLHTDLHECLGHGSGKLLPGVSPDALKAYGNTIEEARADLFGLYYLADDKLLELGLVPDKEAYRAQYYTYMMNGSNDSTYTH